MVRSSCEGGVRRLRVETIGLHHLHHRSDETPMVFVAGISVPDYPGQPEAAWVGPAWVGPAHAALLPVAGLGLLALVVGIALLALGNHPRRLGGPPSA